MYVCVRGGGGLLGGAALLGGSGIVRAGKYFHIKITSSHANLKHMAKVCIWHESMKNNAAWHHVSQVACD